jgi:hypothetical protein
MVPRFGPTEQGVLLAAPSLKPLSGVTPIHMVPFVVQNLPVTMNMETEGSNPRQPTEPQKQKKPCQMWRVQFFHILRVCMCVVRFPH